MVVTHFKYYENIAKLLSTSESLGIAVTPGTLLMQSVNMGDRELCENVWFSTESRSENSAEWAVLRGPPLY